MFTKEELKNIKCAINELISSRIIYLNSTTISEKEKEYTESKLDENYSLLAKVLKLIENVEG